MADSEVQNFNSEIIANGDGPQSMTNILDSNDYNTSETILNDDEPQIVKNVFNSNDYVLSETIFNNDRSQSATNILNSDSYIISETIFNDDRPQITKNVLNSNDNIISETIVSVDEPQNMINILTSSNSTTSETILNDDGPQSEKNVLNSNNYVLSETILNDDGSQSVTNILNSDNSVISETITDNDGPQITNNLLMSDDNIISETIVNGDGPQNMTNIFNNCNYTISEIIFNDDEPQSKTNILNSNDDIIPDTVFNIDRPQIVTNNLNTNDFIISEVILNDERIEMDKSILNMNDTRATIEISNSDSLNTNEVVISPLHLKKDSFNDTKVNLPVFVSDQSIINGHCEDYVIGDIVWAKIGKYPFWPSIICSDPESNTYYRKKKKIWFHVRFCNDKGRRSWIKTIENYSGKNELLSKYPNCLTYIKNSEKLMDIWNLAVQEADNLLKLDGEVRMIEFTKTFSNLDDIDSVTSSASINYSEDTTATIKVRTYSRKRSLTVPEHDTKIIKTENISVNGSSSSRSIDIPLLSRSDDADSTVSDISMNHVYIEDIGLKTNEEILKKRKSTKTYPPKSSFTHKYDLSNSMKTSLEYNGNNVLLSDNHDEFADKTMSFTRSVPEHRKFEVRLKSEKEVCLVNNDQNTNLAVRSNSLSNSKKTVSKKKRLRKESSTGRKSLSTKSESSPEPDTTESEASSKNETYSSVFLASTKNKQLFVKILKKACVVCKNTENTVKCTGPCQSYFHEECLTISEERYRKSEPKIAIKNKKHGRRKRHYSKCTNKKKDTIAGLQQAINNTDEENIDKLYENDNFSTKSINDLNSLLEKQSSDRTNQKSLENPTSDGLTDLSKEENCIFALNEDTQRLSKLEILDKVLIPEISKEKIINTSMKSVTNEKLSKDDSKFMCSLCKANKTYCFACGLDIEDHGQKIMCKMPSCGKYYHENCLKDWPQCQWIQGLRNNIRCVVCPHHVCHLCISDNPKSSCKTHFPGEKLSRCIKCPTAYHRSEYCLPAGSQVLTYFDIICSRHFEPSKLQNYHYNAPWCFICTLGGTLICCDLCPSSFHIECLNQNPSEFEDGFTCEECQTGRYPLYGEIVWVKIGQYRWWPAQIVFPNQVPDTVNAIAHSVGQFAVRFFGTYDYYWVNRGRVFNFHEGDDENILKKNKMKIIDQVFQDAIVEAAQAHNAYIIEKDKNDAIIAKKSLTKPPKFIRIKFNKPIGKVKNMEYGINTMNPCECDPTKPNPCGPGSDCINRMLMFECQPQLCPAGDKCNNQRFEKTLYPAMVPFLTKGRGWGLKTLEDIKEGSFIIEYVGDVIDEEEFQRRCLEMHQRNEQNYYFLTIDNSRMIDAGPKGNLSRFMNHSCEPNCVTQKWTVNGDTRIGLFALHDIPSGTELVFDYRLQSCSGVEKKPCQCGAARCSKFIGVKVEEEKKKLISTNDADKCKTTTKNKRKPLKLKDNVSDSDKSKVSKVLKNDQNISIIENEVFISNDEKMYESKKSKIKQSTILKNENSESAIKPAIKRKWKNSKKNNTSTTKDDVTVNSLELDASIKSKRKNVSTISSRKLLIKKNVFKTSLLPVPNNCSELSKVSTLCVSKAKGHVGILKNIEDMKMTRISVDSSNDLMKTEQIYEILNNAHVNIPNGYTETQERSRHSLSRLAKSRHSFLSKINSNKEKNEHPVVSKKKFNKEKKITTKISKTKIKHREILSIKTSLIKKTKMNIQCLQSKTYYKNDSCLICDKGQAELTCKNKKCPRVFHLSCMNKTRIVKSGFICPSHFCSVCKKRKVVAKCKFCVESFCTTHVKGNIFKDPLGNGMLCITHHPNKKPLPSASSSVTTCPSVNSKLSVTNTNTESESIDFTDSNLSIAPTEHLPQVDEDQLNLNEINEEKYNLTQVVKTECDREYIHIGGFNVCNMSDLVTDQEERYTVPVDTDGDLFKPSSANVVIDIESASALYQPTDSFDLESIAIESKDSHDYANVHFIPDASQTKNKWLAAEP